MDLKEQLIQTALEMRKRSRAPYSHYYVGAAVAAGDDAIVGGCNVENASYGLTCCAERVALFRAVAEGYQAFVALAVATEDGGSPCGACRQVIWELCGDIPIYVVDQDGNTRETTSGQLLPDAFDSAALK